MHTYIINLERRPDRLEQVLEAIKTAQIDTDKLQVLAAIDALDIADKVKMVEDASGQQVHAGKLACLLSHLAIYETFEQSGEDYCLILEDDVIFDRFFLEKFNNSFFNIPRDFDILYLGASDYNLSENLNASEAELTKGYYKARKSAGRFAYVLAQKAMPTVLDCFKNVADWWQPGDQLLKAAQDKLSCYTIYPNLVIANVGDSDLREARNIEHHAKKLGWNLDNFDYKQRTQLTNNKRMLTQFTASIINQKPFTFAKFGDGEMYCMEGRQGHNCDNHPYSPTLGASLRKAFTLLSQNPQAYIADWSNDYREAFIKAENLSPQFVNFNLLLHDKPANLLPEKRKFFEAIKHAKVKKILVAPAKHHAIGQMLNVDAHIQVPLIDAWQKHEDILGQIFKEFEVRAIYLFSCGMPAKFFISKLNEATNGVTCIDLGSSFDPLIGHNNRKKQVSQAELLQFYAGMLPEGLSTPHFYEEIQGWFNFQSIYSEAVANAPQKAHFVEVGAWMGKSTAFMAVEIANSRKQITFDVIDTWQGTPSEIGGAHKAAANGSIFSQFKANLKPMLHLINPKAMPSLIGALQYADNSLDFVFIDADHSYEAVAADIAAWWPKIKTGGTLAGHDYKENFPGVIRAVTEAFGTEPQIIKTSWRMRKGVVKMEMGKHQTTEAPNSK